MDDSLVLTACTVDLARGRVYRDGQEHQLTGVEAELLRYLAARAGQEVTRSELLVKVWKYREGVASRAVDIATSRVRKVIERDSAAPDHLFGIRGVGYRFVVGSVAAAPVEAPPAISLLGRGPVLAEWMGLAAVGKPLWVVGPPGVGKTALAQAAVQQTPGSVFCDLTGASGRERVLALLAREVGLGASASVTAVGDALARRPGLVVLDGMDGAMDATPWVEEWAKRAKLWVISQARPKERVPVVLEPLAEADAVALFLQEAQKTGVSEDHLPLDAVRRLVNRADRLPLAIRWAAAYADVLSVEQASERLGLTAISEGPLAATLATAWDRLTAETQAALWQWSVFRGGFSLEAAEAVAADLSVPAMVALKELVQRNLLRSESRAGKWRFSMLATVRQFAWAERTDPEAREAVQRRWWAAVSQSSESDVADLEAVFRLEPSASVGLALATHYRHYGPVSAVEDIVEQSLTLELPDELRAAFWHRRAESAWLQGRAEDAERQLAQARRLAPENAAILATQVTFELTRGRPVLPTIEAGLAVARQQRDAVHEAILLRQRGTVRRREGDLRGGREDLLKAIALFAKVGRASDRAVGTVLLGEIEENEGGFDAAGSRYLEAHAMYVALGAVRGQSMCLLDRVGIHLWAGEWSDAGEVLAKAESVAMADEPRWEAYHALRKGGWLAGTGEIAAAQRAWAAGIRTLATVTQWSLECALRVESAWLYLDHGEPGAAGRILDPGRLAEAPAGNQPLLHGGWALCAAALGDAVDWAALLEESSRVEHLGERTLLEARLAIAAQKAEASEAQELAKRCLRSSRTLRLPAGAPIWTWVGQARKLIS